MPMQMNIPMRGSPIYKSRSRMRGTGAVSVFLKKNTIIITVKHVQNGHSLIGKIKVLMTNEPVHEISNHVVCATSKVSDQPAHMRSLIRSFARRLSIL